MANYKAVEQLQRALSGRVGNQRQLSRMAATSRSVAGKLHPADRPRLMKMAQEFDKRAKAAGKRGGLGEMRNVPLRGGDGRIKKFTGKNVTIEQPVRRSKMRGAASNVSAGGMSGS